VPETPHDALCRLTATEAVLRLKRREITPLDLIAAAARRIAQVEPGINALPTLCIARAGACREADARRRPRAEAEPGWLAGLPVAIKDLADVAGVRTTYGSPIFLDHVPTRSHPVVERIERKGGIVICTVEPQSGHATIHRCARKRIHGALCWL
jgi:amidase